MEPVRRAVRRITMLPFIGSEALAAGVVSRYQLATQYDAVYRNVYVPRGKVQLRPGKWCTEIGGYPR
jgi:hypothetical protein